MGPKPKPNPNQGGGIVPSTSTSSASRAKGKSKSSSSNTGGQTPSKKAKTGQGQGGQKQGSGNAANQQPSPSPARSVDPPAINPNFYQLKLSRDSGSDKRIFHKSSKKRGGLRVVLVQNGTLNDQDWPYGMLDPRSRFVCILAVGVGQADDPLNYPGLAQLVQHMYTGRRHPHYWFEAAASGNVLSFEGATYEDMTVFTLVALVNDQLKDTLKSKFRRFTVNCGDITGGKYNLYSYNPQHMHAEADRLRQKYELNNGSGWLRFQEISRKFHRSDQSLNKPTGGENLSSKINDPDPNIQAQQYTALMAAIKTFIEEHYKLQNCVLVLQDTGTFTKVQLEEFADAIYDELDVMKPPQQTGPGPQLLAPAVPPQQGATGGICPPPNAKPPIPLNTTAFNKIYYIQPSLHEDMIYLSWYVDYKACSVTFSRVQPLLYIEALLNCTNEGSLIASLREKKFITSFDTVINRRCDQCVSQDPENFAVWSGRNNAYLFTIRLSLTKEGVANYYSVITAVMLYVRQLEADEEIYKTIQMLRRANIGIFGAFRRPEESAKKVACSVLHPPAYNVNALTDDMSLHSFEKTEIDRVLKILRTQQKLNVIIMAHLNDADMTAAFGSTTQLRRLQDGEGVDLTFTFAERAFDQNDIDEWFGNPGCSIVGVRMPTQKELDADADNEAWKKLCKENCERYCDLGHAHPEARDKDFFHDAQPATKDRDAVPDGGRRLQIRATAFHLLYSIVKVQIWQPEYIVHSADIVISQKAVKPLPRALLLLLCEMINTKTKLEENTWCEKECLVITTHADWASGLTVTIQGLHHLTVKWFRKLLNWLTRPQDEFDELKQISFESAQQKLLADIYKAGKMCEDLTLRGTVLGYDALIDCHEFLRQFQSYPDIFACLLSFLREMQITMYPLTNVSRGFEEDGIIEAFKALPFYDCKKSKKQSNTVDRHRRAKFDEELRIKFTSLNTGSSVGCVRNTYQLRLKKNEKDTAVAALNEIQARLMTQLWQQVVYELNWFTYEPEVAFDATSDPGNPILYVQIATSYDIDFVDIAGQIDNAVAQAALEAKIAPVTSPVSVTVNSLFQRLLKVPLPVIMPAPPPAHIPAGGIIPPQPYPPYGGGPPGGVIFLPPQPQPIEIRLYQIKVYGNQNAVHANNYPSPPDYSNLSAELLQAQVLTKIPCQTSHLTTGRHGTILSVGYDMKKNIDDKND